MVESAESSDEEEEASYHSTSHVAPSPARHTYASQHDDVSESMGVNGRIPHENNASQQSLFDEDTIGDSIDAQPTLKPSTSGELYYVTQLQQQIAEFTKRIAEQYTEMEDLRSQLRLSNEDKVLPHQFLERVINIQRRHRYRGN